jgi:hypothetical protein
MSARQEHFERRECLPGAIQRHTAVCRSGDPRDRHAVFDSWHDVVLRDDVGQPTRQRLGIHAVVVAVERSCRATA